MKRNWTYKAKFHHDPYMFLILNSDGIVIAELSGENFTIDEAIAHAKLIAAAPQLLATCQWINAFISTAKDGGDIWCALRNQPGAKEWTNGLQALSLRLKH